MFPRSSYAVPQLKMAALGGDLQGQVVVHENDSNSLFLLNPAGKELRALNFKSIVDNTKEKLTRHFSVEKGKFVMSSEFAHENIIIVYQEDSNEMDVVDVITIQPNILPCRLSLNSFIRSPATCGSYVRLAPTGSTY